MIADDEDALICDFAEYYRIYNIYEMDVEYIATLALGLRDNSRTKMKASGLMVDPEVLLLARIADNTTFNLYAKTKDAAKGRNRPKSIVEALVKKEKNGIRGFETVEAFEAEMRRLHGDGIR